MAKPKVSAYYIKKMSVDQIKFVPIKKDGNVGRRGMRTYVYVAEGRDKQRWVEYPTAKKVGGYDALEKYLNKLIDEWERKKRPYIMYLLNPKLKGALITNYHPDKGVVSRKKVDWN